MGILLKHQSKFVVATTAVTAILFSIPSTVLAKVSGNARFGYYSAERDTRSNTQTESKQFRLRLRVAYSQSLTDKWSAKIRYAGRYSDDQKQSDHKFFQEIPGSDGLRLGEGTLDNLYFRYKNNSDYQITFGRQQTKKELDGVAKKSLDRNNSPNTDVSWTDGVVFDTTTKSNWHHQAIAQINYKKGATEVRRGPLDFTSQGTRLSYFYALENRKRAGAIVQRGLDISYLPNALCVDGLNCGNRKDYIGLVARGAAKWAISTGEPEFMLAASLGYAPNTQLNTTAKIGNSGNTSGTAYQVTANFINFLHLHSVGLVYGKVDAGWLLSPDFRNNNTLMEIRYKWILDKKQKFEARIRKREEIEQRTASAQKQVDNDFYIRYTVKF
ncbi:hypothetical protein MNBD_GAMMA22-411 [hydrothermal vent metagenome]|uniref:Porin domain-containing protein n=1 Tax=hydrothermal vent metagenome TaxID=652676 RepID=A0A3B1ARX9_9ZZZZ